MKFGGILKKLLLHEVDLNNDEFDFPERSEPSRKGFGSDRFSLTPDDFASDDDLHPETEQEHDVMRLVNSAYRIAKEKKIEWNRIEEYIFGICMALSEHPELHVDAITDVLYIGETLSVKVHGTPITGAASHVGHEFDHMFSLKVSENKMPMFVIKTEWRNQINDFLKDMQTRFSFFKKDNIKFKK